MYVNTYKLSITETKDKFEKVLFLLCRFYKGLYVDVVGF